MNENGTTTEKSFADELREMTSSVHDAAYLEKEVDRIYDSTITKWAKIIIDRIKECTVYAIKNGETITLGDKKFIRSSVELREKDAEYLKINFGDTKILDEAQIKIPSVVATYKFKNYSNHEYIVSYKLLDRLKTKTNTTEQRITLGKIFKRTKSVTKYTYDVEISLTFDAEKMFSKLHEIAKDEGITLLSIEAICYGIAKQEGDSCDTITSIKIKFPYSRDNTKFEVRNCFRLFNPEVLRFKLNFRTDFYAIYNCSN